MNRAPRNRARIAGLLVAAVGVLAMLALPGIAAAKHRDRNHDRIPDRWEKRHHLSLKVSQANRDQDQDQLGNLGEFQAGDNPRDDDSDDDGVMDGDENAGTIQSFDAETGRLTIALFGGETQSGLITSETEIKCEHSEESTTASASHESGDSSGPGSGEEEPGDDDNGDNSGPGSSNSGPGNHNDDENEHENEGNCTTADLVPGAVVDEADLKLANGTATFEEVELGG
jgi:hypothetical protein